MTSLSFSEKLENIREFYSLLAELETRVGGYRTLAEAHGRLTWPKRGVYFFFEPGELRSTSGHGYRVVRVGTHALKNGSKTTLWKRLGQHQGSQSSGGGNHRGSVFRLHVGAALVEKGGWPNDIGETWGKGSSAPKEVRQNELPLEKAVSNYICQMPFLWIDIDDEPGKNSMRGYIERNAIALLSNYHRASSIDPPNSQWLGSWAQRETIRDSGLWNVNHVDENYDPDFLSFMAR